MRSLLLFSGPWECRLHITAPCVGSLFDIALFFITSFLFKVPSYVILFLHLHSVLSFLVHPVFYFRSYSVVLTSIPTLYLYFFPPLSTTSMKVFTQYQQYCERSWVYLNGKSYFHYAITFSTWNFKIKAPLFAPLAFLLAFLLFYVNSQTFLK